MEDIDRKLGALDDTANAALNGMFQLARLLAERGILRQEDITPLVQTTFDGITSGFDRGLRDHIRNVSNELRVICEQQEG